jgi:hypothetical protein
VLKQGSIGALAGLSVGVGGVLLASRRYPSFAQMPLSFKTFLVTGITGGTAVTVADRASLSFERMKYAGPKEKVVLPVDSDWKHRVFLFLNWG